MNPAKKKPAGNAHTVMNWWYWSLNMSHGLLSLITFCDLIHKLLGFYTKCKTSFNNQHQVVIQKILNVQSVRFHSTAITNKLYRRSMFTLWAWKHLPYVQHLCFLCTILIRPAPTEHLCHHCFVHNTLGILVFFFVNRYTLEYKVVSKCMYIVLVGKRVVWE